MPSTSQQLRNTDQITVSRMFFLIQDPTGGDNPKKIQAILDTLHLLVSISGRRPSEWSGNVGGTH